MGTSQMYDAPQLSVLIGAPHLGETAMHHDLVAMYEALGRRGLAPEEILSLEGALDRRLLLGFMEAIHHRIAGWKQGSLFLYVSGHGFLTGENAEEARVGVELGPTKQVEDEFHVFWDELFEALALPPGVSMTLLPDH